MAPVKMKLIRGRSTSVSEPQLPAPGSAPPGRARLRLFRLAASTLVPAALLLAAETALILVGYGHRTGFLERAGRDLWTTNQRYGWRFFPLALARAPVPFLLPVAKGDAYRVLVIGSSAARGTPDSAYSFGRVLEVLLEASYPQTRFEVINAAITAINSHVALDIVRSCVRIEPDLMVVYLGNNEVVGPYGAGTIFGSFSPSLPMIRASIAVKATRLGQLVAAAVGAGTGGPAEWRGMEMYLEQRVAADDPRLQSVYRHFERNLAEIVASAHDAGARTLLLTVAGNLRDQPPFASLHREGLSPDEARRWQALVATGAQAAAAGNHDAALASWQAAAVIDDHHAELHYRVGRSLLALGRDGGARQRLIRARDLDALRFRADSRINDTIRRVAAREAGRGSDLLDIADRFAGGIAGSPPLPGRRLFHEHVHLNFEGNRALAAAIAERIEVLLPARIRQHAAAGRRPDAAEVAERLAFTPFDRWSLSRDILAIVSRPPFVDQLDHATELEQRRLGLGRLNKQLGRKAWRDAEALYLRALTRDPDDLEIRRRFATLLQSRGRHRDAAQHWRYLLERLPAIDRWRNALAMASADAGDGEAALAELEYVRKRSGDSADLRVNRGTVLESLGRGGEADDEYAQALGMQPGHKPASFNLATAAMRRGELERAEELFRKLLERHGDFAPGHHNLGRCLEHQGRLEEAVAAYLRATLADPGLAAARNSLALALERRGEPNRALAEYRLILAYQSDYALAHFNLADLLLSLGRAAEAAFHYRRGLELRPDNAQARANRTLALRMLAEEK